jgi:argininosuccinate lyase
MPQKRNPTAVTQVQSSPDKVVGELMKEYMNGRGMSGKAAPGASVLSEAILHIEHWASVIRDVEFNRELARDQLDIDWVFATDIAGLLVREEGIPWRSAHQIVGILVRTAEAQDMDMRDVTVAEIEDAAMEYLGESIDISEDQLKAVIDPDRAVQARSMVSGSPAPNQVQEQIDKGRSALRENQETLAELQERKSAAASLLESAIDDIIATH